MSLDRLSGTVLEPGTRALSRVFPDWIRGEVVWRNGSLYTVRVDPDVGHFSDTVLIQQDEIVEEHAYRVEEARREVERAKDDLKWANANLRVARSTVEVNRRALRAARAALRTLEAGRDAL